MDEKVVLITGGSSGIGKSTGIFLTSKGMKVYGTTRNLRKHKDFSHFELLEMDVTDDSTIDRTINTIIENEGRIDVLLNNAGVGITGPIEETPIDEVVNAYNTNLNGPLRMIQAVLPFMRKQQGGLIINITSIAGYMGLPFRGIYSATKGSLELITEALRMETRPFNIHITNLAPGDFATNIATGRYHTPVFEHSPYKDYHRTLTSINDDVADAQDPILVAKKIFAIMKMKSPKGHYLVGTFMQKLSVFLKRLLPSTIFERLLLNHYNL